MDFFHLLTQNFLSPAILFFVLGVLAGFFKSDLEIPDGVSRYLPLYLMMAIGFKGGVAMAATPLLDTTFLLLVMAGLGFGFLFPLFGFALLRKTTPLDTPTAAAVAAQYGSISMVTFVTGVAFLNQNSIPYAGYIVAIVALMEAPAILSGLWLAHKNAPETARHGKEDRRLMREIFTNGAIMMLLGALLVGWITGEAGKQKMDAFLIKPFDGVLALFLLDMGLLVAKNLQHLRALRFSVMAFGIYMPLLGASIGLLTAMAIGLPVGTGILFMVLCASASYIAVPAAMRLALPEAKAGVYLPLSLAITFPMNVILGIPLYGLAAQHLLSH